MKVLGPALFAYVALLLDDLTAVAAIRLPVSGRRVERRASMSGEIVNSADVKYWTNVTLGGKVFSALIDTGSSDLWVAGDVPNAKDTGKSTSIAYVIGDVDGPIKTAEMEFEGFKVPNQAFIQATADSSHKAGQGIIGLGPSSGSHIQSDFSDTSGLPPLDNIFSTNKSTPNFITVYLGRSDDPTNLFPGDLTVGSTIPDFDNVTAQPKLPVVEVSNKGAQHWQTLLDRDGIIGPDGQVIPVTSKVKNSDKNRLNVIFDSGFTLPQVPKSVSDAIYSRVPGANFTSFAGTGPVWSIPCDVELNITFKFANVSFPIHPLDTSLSELNVLDANGVKVCVGAFQPTPASAVSSTYDMILGMAFLRNAYMLINFGDFVDGASSSTADPYIQLLPLTGDRAQAHSDFVTVRLNGDDDTGSFHLLNANSTQIDEDNNDSSDDTAEPWTKRYLPEIIAGAAVVAILLLGGVGLCLTRNRRKAYRPLHEPAPGGLSQQPPPFAQYQPSRRY